MPRKKQTNEDEKINDSWLLPYADMLTLLLALFIVLFAMSEIDLQKFQRLAYIFETEFTGGAGIIDEGVNIVPEATPDELLDHEQEDEQEDDQSLEELQAAQEYEQLKAIQEDIEEYIVSNDLIDTIGTELSGEGLLISIQTDVTFDSGSAVVKEEGKEVAKEIATFLNTDPPHEIVVNGHTDDVPIRNEEYASNWELSTMRAIQFLYLLLEDTDIDPKWFSARGYGEYRPKVPNTSAENRTINRRVEVLILPNYDIEKEVDEAENEEREA